MNAGDVGSFGLGVVVGAWIARAGDVRVALVAGVAVALVAALWRALQGARE